jgi:hypothetical protein
MTIRPVVLIPVTLLALAAPALAKECREGAGSRRATERRGCAPPPLRELKPYDPRDHRPTERGVIDLGNGTTVRVGGSVGVEADVVRR